jgi:hypothetical protein
LATQALGEAARVLITVKATPQPSTKYGDTVCVAGLRLDDGPPRWIRLYPIPFRFLDSDQQFHKYEIVELDVRRRHSDGRHESYSPELSTIRREAVVKGWSNRAAYFEDLPRPSMCDLRKGIEADTNGTSLALIQVADVSGLTFTPHGDWNEAERRKLDAFSTQAGLFDFPRNAPALRAPRFKASYKFRCDWNACPGHTARILDWELTALQNRLAHDSDEDVKRKVREKFLDLMFSKDRATGLFVGNFERATKRKNFSVLGTYYPKTADAAKLSLF